MGGVTPHRNQIFTGRQTYVMGGGTPHKQFALVTVYGGVSPTPYRCPSFTWPCRKPFHRHEPLPIHAFSIPTSFAKYANYLPRPPTIIPTTQPRSLSTQQPPQLIQPQSSPTWSFSPPTQASFPPTHAPSISPIAYSSHLSS